MLLKYVKEKNPYKDEDYCKTRSSEIWYRYGEKAVKKAMNHSACTSLSELERLAKAFNNEA